MIIRSNLKFKRGNRLPHSNNDREYTQYSDYIRQPNLLAPGTEFPSDTAINLLSELGISDWKTVYLQHIENTKTLGLMPTDSVVIEKTLCDFHFRKKRGYSRKLRSPNGYSLHDAIVDLSEEKENIYILSVEHHLIEELTNGIKRMIALRFNVGNAEIIGTTLEEKGFKVKCIWSYSPRSRSSTKLEARDMPYLKFKFEEQPKIVANRFMYFQPNPHGLSIDDCSVRAVAGALGIPWEEAIELLAVEGRTHFNSNLIYRSILTHWGFKEYGSIRRRNKLITLSEFCEVMDTRFSSDERIIAFATNTHAVAVVPVDGKYTVLDSWDSTDWKVFSYFVWRG